MQHEDDRDVDRRPGQIEDGVDARAGDELAEGIEIAQQLAARAAELAERSMIAVMIRAAIRRSSRMLARVRTRARTASSPASAMNANSSAMVSITSVTSLALEITRS